jgi:ABC-type branched-subunit amino acid transport system ATPase component
MAILRGALLESPNIMLLIDDPSQGLFPGLAEIVKSLPPVCTDSLMLGAGNVVGWLVSGPEP